MNTSTINQLISVVSRLVFGRYLYDSMQIVDSHVSNVQVQQELHLNKLTVCPMVSFDRLWSTPPISWSVLGVEKASLRWLEVSLVLLRPFEEFFRLSLSPCRNNIFAHIASLYSDIFVFVSTATGSGHYNLLRRGSRAGGYRRDVLQQLLPLLALSAGPGHHSCPKPVGTQREAHPGEIHPPVRCPDPVILTGSPTWTSRLCRGFRQGIIIVWRGKNDEKMQF